MHVACQRADTTKFKMPLNESSVRFLYSLVDNRASDKADNHQPDSLRHRCCAMVVYLEVYGVSVCVDRNRFAKPSEDHSNIRQSQLPIFDGPAHTNDGQSKGGHSGAVALSPPSFMPLPQSFQSKNGLAWPISTKSTMQKRDGGMQQGMQAFIAQLNSVQLGKAAVCHPSPAQPGHCHS